MFSILPNDGKWRGRSPGDLDMMQLSWRKKDRHVGRITRLLSFQKKNFRKIFQDHQIKILSLKGFGDFAFSKESYMNLVSKRAFYAALKSLILRQSDLCKLDYVREALFKCLTVKQYQINSKYYHQRYAVANKIATVLCRCDKNYNGVIIFTTERLKTCF